VSIHTVADTSLPPDFAVIVLAVFAKPNIIKLLIS